jgi:hypothetical protein
MQVSPMLLYRGAARLPALPLCLNDWFPDPQSARRLSLRAVHFRRPLGLAVAHNNTKTEPRGTDTLQRTETQRFDTRKCKAAAGCTQATHAAGQARTKCKKL